MFRPSNVQSKRMDDVGTRSIFTAEQVGPHLNNLDRDVIFLCGRTCSGSQVRGKGASTCIVHPVKFDKFLNVLIIAWAEGKIASVLVKVPVARQLSPPGLYPDPKARGRCSLQILDPMGTRCPWPQIPPTDPL